MCKLRGYPLRDGWYPRSRKKYRGLWKNKPFPSGRLNYLLCLICINCCCWWIKIIITDNAKVKQSVASVRQSPVCFHSIFRTSWPLHFSFVCVWILKVTVTGQSKRLKYSVVYRLKAVIVRFHGAFTHTRCAGMGWAVLVTRRISMEAFTYWVINAAIPSHNHYCHVIGCTLARRGTRRDAAEGSGMQRRTSAPSTVVFLLAPPRVTRLFYSCFQASFRRTMSIVDLEVFVYFRPL